MRFVSEPFQDLKTYKIEHDKILDEIRTFFDYKSFQLKSKYWVLQIQGKNGYWLDYECAEHKYIKYIFKAHTRSNFRILTYDLRRYTNEK